jgi:5-methylcytosine-specific restriction endonuclease McrA
MKDAPIVLLEEVDRRARAFPVSWKDVAIVMLMVDGGVRCPSCARWFRGRRELRTLHMDHVIPYSRGGETTWSNFQLLCAPCNLKKSDELDDERDDSPAGTPL